MHTEEEWRPIYGYPVGMYEISNLGRVRSLPRLSPAQPGVTRMLKGKMLKVSARPGDYPRVTLAQTGKPGQPIPIHGLLMSTFVRPPLPSEEVRHLDGNKLNFSFDNMAWGTRRENMLDKKRHGTDHNLNKTHCPQGHPYDEENTVWNKNGTNRLCRICQRRHGKATAARRRAAQRAAKLSSTLGPCSPSSESQSA